MNIFQNPAVLAGIVIITLGKSDRISVIVGVVLIIIGLAGNALLPIR